MGNFENLQYRSQAFFSTSLAMMISVCRQQ